jgi:hypothetical protein
MKFMGYVRPDGRVGIRNHIAVIPASCVRLDGRGPNRGTSGRGDSASEPARRPDRSGS